MSYRSLKTLQGPFSRFRRHPELAPEYINNPEKIGNMQYDGKNGNYPGTGDGYRYRGGGMIQVTGRANYRALGYESNPEALANPEIAAQTGAKHWRMIGLNAMSGAPLTRAQFDKVTRRINPGANKQMMDDRYARYVTSARVLGLDGVR